MISENPWTEVCEFIFNGMISGFQELYEQWNVTLQQWLDDMLSGPIPDDWRVRLDQFVAETEEFGLEIEPASIRTLEGLIECRAAEQNAAREPDRVDPGRKFESASVAEDGRPEPPRHEGRIMLVADRSRSYRKMFIKATPFMPVDWQVHHVIEQGRKIIAERFRKVGKELDDLDNLRGIPREVHDEVSTIQRKFWAAKVNKYGSLKEAYQRVPLEEVQKLQKQIEATYKGFWVEAGATGKEVAAVEKRLKSKRIMDLKPSRIEGTLKKAGIVISGFAIFTFIAENVVLAKNIIDPPPEVQVALDEMLAQYSHVYDAKITQGTINRKQWDKLADATMRYMEAAGFDDKTKALVRSHFEIEGAQLP